jgi:hypothetical protein
MNEPTHDKQVLWQGSKLVATEENKDFPNNLAVNDKMVSHGQQG